VVGVIVDDIADATGDNVGAANDDEDEKHRTREYRMIFDACICTQSVLLEGMNLPPSILHGERANALFVQLRARALFGWRLASTRDR